MKSIKMFGKKLPILGILLIAMLATGGVYAALITYLSNPIPQDVTIKTPIALAGEVTYWPAEYGVLGTKYTGLAEWSTQFEHDGSYSAHLKTHYLEGKSLEVTSLHLIDVDVELTEEAFNAEPETIVLDDVVFDGQSGTVTIEGTLSDLYLSLNDEGKWPDTAYINIGMRPKADKDRANAGVWMVLASTSYGGGPPYKEYKVQLQDWTGQPTADEKYIMMPRGLADYRYKITFVPEGSIGGTAHLEFWAGGEHYGHPDTGEPLSHPYGYEGSWVELESGDRNEDYSEACFFYSIKADRRGETGHIYSATFGDINVDTGAEARIVIPMPEGTTLGDLDSISWWVYTVTGYPPHVDIYLDVDGDNVLDLEDVLTAEMACNPDQTIKSIADSLPGEWVQTFESDTGYGPAVIDGFTTFWVAKMGSGTYNAPYGTLNELLAGEGHLGPGCTEEDFLANYDSTTLVLRMEIEVDNWVVPSEVYVDDIKIVLDAVDNDYGFEPDTKSFTGEVGTSLAIFAGSEFYFDFDVENQANLPMDGKLQIVIDALGTVFEPEPDVGAEFEDVTDYEFTLSIEDLVLTAEHTLTFEPVIPVYLSLHLKLKPNVEPDTYKFTAQIVMP